MDAAHVDAIRGRFLTKRIPSLLGYQLVPVGVLFLLSAVWDVGLLPLPWGDRPHVPGRWFLGAFVAALAASEPIRRWYQKKLSIRVSRRFRDLPNAPMLAIVAC